MATPIERCRLCGNSTLVAVVDLGEHALTGVFPRACEGQDVRGPLTLVKCTGTGPDVCGLLQLAHSYDLRELYGDRYGYRSGLNVSMVRHLDAKVHRILSFAPLEPGDLVVDIGSNDGTTLRAYPEGRYTLVGVDPTGCIFQPHYPPHVDLIPHFFSRDLLANRYPGRAAKLVTSFSMFYDLEDPTTFVREIYDLLDDDGLWIFEQSYMPFMLETNSYDTICQEHLEYYCLKQIKWLADRTGFDIVDVEFNDVNGGSFSVTVAKRGGPYEASADVPHLLRRESELGLDDAETYRAFDRRIQAARDDLVRFIRDVKASGKRIYGLGASTKGNVILQYCGLTRHDLEFIGEVNGDKFGCLTPGTRIPIVPEDDLLEMDPDYLLVLPWHFRSFFEGSRKFKCVPLVFPLPRLDVVGTPRH